MSLNQAGYACGMPWENQLELASWSWCVISDLQPAAEEDLVDDWQMAKPRRQQQKQRGNGAAAPEPAQQEQTNGHSQAPPPSLPQRQEVPPQGPPPAVAVPSPRKVPAGAMADQGTATRRSLSTPGCLKCQDPSHKCVHRASPCTARISCHCYMPFLANKKSSVALAQQSSLEVHESLNRRRWNTLLIKKSSPLCPSCLWFVHRLADCPDLLGLPSFVRREIKMALVEGDAQRVQLLLTRNPVHTCQQCDAPGHSLYNCPQLEGMPSRMRDDLRRAYVQADVQQKCEILVHWKRMQAGR